MRDVENGWLIRYIHANVASFFFIFVYAHVGRNIYYGSFKTPRVLVWSIGVIILVLMIAIGFLGLTHSPLWFDNIYSLSFFNLSYNNCDIAIFPTMGSPRLQAILSKHNLKPKAVWENLDRPDIKAEVYAVLKLLAGVYLIVNLNNGKMYVGSGVLARMQVRFHKHLFSGQGSQLVWHAVNKHGLSNFAFIVLDTVSNYVAENNRKLLDIEDHYITILKPEYNISQYAGNTLGLKHTEVTKTKMKLNYSSERREAIGSLNRGKKFSSSTIGLIRQAALNRPPMSLKTRNKVSANSSIAQLFNVSMVKGTPLTKGDMSIVLRTISAVASYCNCGEKTVRRALKSNGVIKGTYLVVKLDKSKK